MTTDITQRLAEIKERAERATKEPWVRFAVRKRIGGAHFIAVGPENLPIILVPTGTLAESQHEALIDATFIANARSDVPFLLAEIERLNSCKVARNSLARQISREAKSTGKLKKPKP